MPAPDAQACSETVGNFPFAVEAGLCLECGGLLQCVQPPVAESVLAQGESLGAELAKKLAGNNAALMVTEDFLDDVACRLASRAALGSRLTSR